MLFLLLLLSTTPDPRAEARRLFQQASAEYAAGDVSAALHDFRQAYGDDPAPGFLFDIAQCQRDLHRWDEAIASFRQYLTAKPGAKNADLVRDLIAQMSPKPDDPPKAAQPPKLPPPLVPERPPNPPLIPTGSPMPTPALSLDATAAREGTRTVPWWVAGSGGVTLITGAVLGSVALSIAGGDQIKSDPALAARRENSLTLGQAGTANTLATVSLPLLVAGAGIVATGVIWGLSPRGSTFVPQQQLSVR